YQWQKDGVDIAGATSSSYTISNPGSAHAGVYQVLVSSSSGGTVWSEGATLTVNLSPTFTQPPTHQAVVVEDTAVFQAAATGTTPIWYQWYAKRGETWESIAGATGNSLSVAEAHETDQGETYKVRAFNVAGQKDSAEAVLVVAGGTVLREWWTGVPGTSIAHLEGHLNYPDAPTGRVHTNIFEAPVSWANEYGTRMRGYIHPPVSGDYRFWIAADDSCELWLSTDENPTNMALIAYSTAHTGSREWEKYATQKSGLVTLEAGKTYYIEALHKEGWGGDHLAVGWQLPGGALERPIPGNRLSSEFQEAGSWPLAEGEGSTAFDLSVNPHDGVITSPIWVNNSVRGPVLEFDGALTSTRRVEIPDTQDLDITGELTVSAWVYSTAAPATQGRTAASRYWYAGTAPGDQTGWNLGAEWTTTQFRFLVCGPDAVGNKVVKSVSIDNFFSAYSATWVHVTGVYKPGVSVSIYTNGVLSSTRSDSIPVAIEYSATQNDALRIGRRAQNQSHWAGHISDVRIYRQALEPGEIEALYQKGYPRP
ncbi:MAG: LamG-like jellyroll fold domain-containing protein, partial [Kiritimatiellia bacterium]|nr:LamG-like jellyroll fold domain-containing protein [Kiritimatiellia bacterium]